MKRLCNRCLSCPVLPPIRVCAPCKMHTKRKHERKHYPKTLVFKRKKYANMSPMEKEVHYKRNRLSRYRMTPEAFDALYQKQKGKCAICEEFKGQSLKIDHDHNTGQVRGLLCNKCNSGLGGLGDNIEGLRKALAYLDPKF